MTLNHKPNTQPQPPRPGAPGGAERARGRGALARVESGEELQHEGGQRLVLTAPRKPLRVERALDGNPPPLIKPAN